MKKVNCFVIGSLFSAKSLLVRFVHTSFKLQLSGLLLLLLSLQEKSFSQNLGIGTTTPVEKLHVAGNIKTDTLKPNAIKLTPNAGIGKILTSDANGNANWQNNSFASGNIGYGVWGDCATNANISEYQPVADATGAVGDNFGNSVSISGNYAIVGSPLNNIGANDNQGSASIYKWNGDSWIFMQKITDATGAAEDRFGYSVSISGNYAIVGAFWDDVGANAEQGSASIYRWNGSSWVLVQKITDATGAAEDNFGRSVSISGNYAIVGAWSDDIGGNVDQGSASIYQLNGSSWVLMQKITDATGAAGDYFGYSVSISGNYAMLGSSGNDIGGNINQGSASIYQWNGSNWILMQKITDADGASGDNFGLSVSISGNNAIVGAPSANVGATEDAGSACIYKWNGSNWVMIKKFIDASGGYEDYFGISVCISGNYAIVGTSKDNVGGNPDLGSCTIFLQFDNAWQKLQYLTEPNGENDNYFGCSVSIDGPGKRFMAGAGGFASYRGKVVFGKLN